MITSPQTNNRYLTFSRWLAARYSQARIAASGHLRIMFP